MSHIPIHSMSIPMFFSFSYPHYPWVQDVASGRPCGIDGYNYLRRDGWSCTGAGCLISKWQYHGDLICNYRCIIMYMIIMYVFMIIIYCIYIYIYTQHNTYIQIYIYHIYIYICTYVYTYGVWECTWIYDRHYDIWGRLIVRPL